MSVSITSEVMTPEKYLVSPGFRQLKAYLAAATFSEEVEEAISVLDAMKLPGEEGYKDRN